MADPVVPPKPGRLPGRGRPHVPAPVSMADGPPTPQAALPQPKSRQASESVAPGTLPTAFVVSFAEEASLEAQAAAVAAKVAELQSVHDSLRAELDLRSRVKQLSGELAAANARCAEMESAALKARRGAHCLLAPLCGAHSHPAPGWPLVSP
jgi:hypothetical protein